MDDQEKQAQVLDVDIERLSAIVVGNIVGFAEKSGGVKKVTFGQFVSSIVDGYADAGIDLDLRFATSVIAAWCGFSGIVAPGWCIGVDVKTSSKNGRMFRAMADATYAELRRRGVSINDATAHVTRVRGASA